VNADEFPPTPEADHLSAEGKPLLVVGTLVAAQGLAGELRILPRSDFPERFTQPGPRWLLARQGMPRAVELLGGRQLPGKSLFAVRLAGVSSRDAAEALVHQEFLVDASQRPKLAPGEFHLLDLVGLQVRLLDAAAPPPSSPGEPIGRVVDLIHGGNDLLAVELAPAASPPAGSQPAPGRRVLIPFVEAIVPQVNLQEGWIGITPPPGLLDL
jgi:16S rRNA processing protein RimM